MPLSQNDILGPKVPQNDPRRLVQRDFVSLFVIQN